MVLQKQSAVRKSSGESNPDIQVIFYLEKSQEFQQTQKVPKIMHYFEKYFYFRFKPRLLSQPDRREMQMPTLR